MDVFPTVGSTIENTETIKLLQNLVKNYSFQFVVEKNFSFIIIKLFLFFFKKDFLESYTPPGSINAKPNAKPNSLAGMNYFSSGHYTPYSNPTY